LILRETYLVFFNKRRERERERREKRRREGYT
jgi:hypothetical protein